MTALFSHFERKAEAMSQHNNDEADEPMRDDSSRAAHTVLLSDTGEGDGWQSRGGQNKPGAEHQQEAGGPNKKGDKMRGRLSNGDGFHAL